MDRKFDINPCLIELFQMLDVALETSRTTRVHHSAIKNVVVILVMEMQGKYKSERPISGRQFVQ